MIFVLVSIFFLNGEPLGKATYNAQNWPTKKECQQFASGKEGKKLETQLKTYLAKALKGAKITIKTDCVAQDDGSI